MVYTQSRAINKMNWLYFNRRWHISSTPNTTYKICTYTAQTNTSILYGHPEFPHEEKLKFEPEEKQFSLLLKVEFSCHKL